MILIRIVIPLHNSTDEDNVKNYLNCSEAFTIICASHFYRVTDGCKLMKERCQKTLQLFHNEFPKIWHMASNKFCGMLVKFIRWVLASTCCFFYYYSTLPFSFLASFLVLSFICSFLSSFFSPPPPSSYFFSLSFIFEASWSSI